MHADLRCFKAYDIRGQVPQELDTDLAYQIGLAFARLRQSKKVVVGYDIRLESPALADALSQGLQDGGTDVYQLGLCGTEEVYFATFNGGFDGGIMVTASHNPKGYNGMKLVGIESQPISGDTGLNDIADAVRQLQPLPDVAPGQRYDYADKTAYLNHLLSYISPQTIRPYKVVFNVGNGSAGAMIADLVKHLPITPIYLHAEPNGEFPNGVPNPLLHENRQQTADAVLAHQADFAVAWDGDFDRCFLFDEKGQFIEGYYLVGLLAQTLLKQHPGAKIIHDPRLSWNTIEQVRQAGGQPIQSKTGHAFIKQRMRQEDAVYGGEMSSHHYFKAFAYCDSGMIPWLLIMQLMSETALPLSALVEQRQQAYPCSGELNYKVNDVAAILDKIARFYADQQPKIDLTDGLSLEFDNWRFNIRASNTEPLLRLNIESRGCPELVAEKHAEIQRLISE
ncbi:MAG: phosphomannomutase [Thiomicrospira sp.]|jgi:phosphomannomutase